MTPPDWECERRERLNYEIEPKPLVGDDFHGSKVLGKGGDYILIECGYCWPCQMRPYQKEN